MQLWSFPDFSSFAFRFHSQRIAFDFTLGRQQTGRGCFGAVNRAPECLATQSWPGTKGAPRLSWHLGLFPLQPSFYFSTPLSILKGSWWTQGRRDSNPVGSDSAPATLSEAEWGRGPQMPQYRTFWAAPCRHIPTFFHRLSCNKVYYFLISANVP